MIGLNEQNIHFPGSGLFEFITFRVLLAMLLSLVIATLFGRKLINYLRRKQVGESVRDLGLAGEQSKKGTPTMGGIIIILSILIPTLLLANLHKVYIRLMIISTIWLGIIGFLDDYLKLRAKRIAKEQGVPYKKGDKDGLAGWLKVMGQIGLGIIVGATLYFNSNVKIWREYIGTPRPAIQLIRQLTFNGKEKYFVETQRTDYHYSVCKKS